MRCSKWSEKVKKISGLFVALCVICNGCGGPSEQADVPSFTLAYSEYPSWSVFGVADKLGYINKDQGKLGPIEEKYGVDIVLNLSDYDTCINLYGNGTADAACLTNMDSLAPALTRDTVAFLPTSTSNGADALIVLEDTTLDDLKNMPTYGLERSVSQYCFERNLELQGKNPTEYKFSNMDPAAAAQAFQTGQAEIESIIVWNPFVLQTLRTRDKSKVLFDSSTIPAEIIDMVVIGKDSLQKPGGEAFVQAVLETYYSVNEQIDNPSTRDATLVALGEDFSNLGLEDMKVVVEQTKFYNFPDKAINLFDNHDFQDVTMPMVVEFCVTHGIIDSKPSIGFNNPDSQMNFTNEYIKAWLPTHKPSNLPFNRIELAP